MLDISRQHAHLINGKHVKCSTCGVKNQCRLQGLSRGELNALDGLAFARRHVERDEMLYYASVAQANIYVVSTGTFKSVVEDCEGAAQITGFYLPGDIMGLDGLGNDLSNSSAIATEFSTVCEIPKADFDKLCSSNDDIRHSLMCALRSEIVQHQEHVMTLGQMSADARVAKFLVDMSKHFEARGYSAAEFNVNIPRHDIANYLALAPETLSRIFKKLQAMKYVQVKRGHIEILNMAELENISHVSSHSRKA